MGLVEFVADANKFDMARDMARELTRLRAALAAVEGLTRDPDGGDADGDAEIPIEKIRRALRRGAGIGA